MTINHLLFDNDGTLVDTEVLAIRTMLGLLREHGFEMDERSYSQRFPGHLEREILQKLTAEHGLQLPNDFMARLRRGHAEAFSHALEAIPGIPMVLQSLRVPKSVVSNAGRPHIEHCMRVTGLGTHVDGQIFSADQVVNPKPAPDLYQLALDTLGLIPEETIVVEDSPVGVRAAKAAGIRTIGFLGASHVQDGHELVLLDAGADWIASDGNALLSMFQRWGVA